MLNEYYRLGGYSFGSVFQIFIVIVFIWMIFTIGSAFYGVFTGRTREGTFLYIIVRVVILLGASQLMPSWIGFP